MDLFRILYYEKGRERTAFVVAKNANEANAHISQSGAEVLNVLCEKQNVQVAHEEKK